MEEMSDVIARQIAINQNTLLFIFHIASLLSPLLPWNNMAECLGFVGKSKLQPQSSICSSSCDNQPQSQTHYSVPVVRLQMEVNG